MLFVFNKLFREERNWHTFAHTIRTAIRPVYETLPRKVLKEYYFMKIVGAGISCPYYPTILVMRTDHSGGKGFVLVQKRLSRNIFMLANSH